MRYFPVIIGILFVVIASLGPAKADAVISGPVCIIDGNNLQVGGKVKNKKCWGGINIRLHGSIAPNLNEVCTNSNGIAWKCGEAAKNALLKMIKMNAISCYHIDGEFADDIPIATCLSGHSDVSMVLVKSGMAKAAHDQSKRYLLEEKDAKKRKRGLWK